MIYSFRNYIMDVFIIASHYCTAPAKTHTHTNTTLQTYTSIKCSTIAVIVS